MAEQNVTATPTKGNVNTSATSVSADKSEVKPEFVIIEVTSKLRKRTKDGAMEDAITLVHPPVLDIIGEAFASQDDFENESKFARAFIYDAVISQAKAQCNRAIGDWLRLVDASTRLHKDWTRDKCESELMSSRKSKRIKEMHDLAVELKAKL